MISIKKYISSNDRYYGKKFIYYNSELDDLVYAITRVPNRYDLSDETHCWVSWNLDGGVGGVEYTWEDCIDNINKGVWVLV